MEENSEKINSDFNLTRLKVKILRKKKIWILRKKSECGGEKNEYFMQKSQNIDFFELTFKAWILRKSLKFVEKSHKSEKKVKILCNKIIHSEEKANNLHI